MNISRSYLANKKILVCGIQGSGKTYLAKWFSRMFQNQTAVYTPHVDEWANEKVVVFMPKDFIAEMPVWISVFKKSKLRFLVIDEADLLFKHHFDTNEEIRDLVINHRHYQKTLCFITRRPQDIPARLYGTFEILCIFTIDSPQVVELLNRWHENLGEMARNLPYGSYQFILKHIGAEAKVCVV